MTKVRRESELSVGFDGVRTLVLERVGPNFIMEANAAAFLPHVKEYSSAFFGNGFDGHVTLEAAVAAKAAEDITGEAFAVNSDEYGFIGIDVAEYESDVLCGIDG
jgi:hypothetical protein